MKKFLLAPFLLASLFSFGGEVKANPGSRYELPDPRSALSENQSNSNDAWYLLNQNVIQWKGYYSPKWGPTSYEKLMITTVSDRNTCDRLASQEKRWIEQFDLGWDGGSNYRYKANTKCIKGRKENKANYFLRIASINMRNKDQDGKNYQYFNNDQEQFSSFDTLYFRNLSRCNLVKSQLDNWFASLENIFLSKSNIFVRYSTKCFSKT